MPSPSHVPPCPFDLPSPAHVLARPCPARSTCPLESSRAHAPPVQPSHATPPGSPGCVRSVTALDQVRSASRPAPPARRALSCCCPVTPRPCPTSPNRSCLAPSGLSDWPTSRHAPLLSRPARVNPYPTCHACSCRHDPDPAVSARQVCPSSVRPTQVNRRAVSCPVVRPVALVSCQISPDVPRPVMPPLSPSFQPSPTCLVVAESRQATSGHLVVSSICTKSGLGVKINP